MMLLRITMLLVSVWTFCMYVDGEVTNIRKCSHGSLRAPGFAKNSYNFSVNLFCNQDCQISNVSTSMILHKTNCSVPTTIDRIQTDVQVRNCGGPEECTERDLATQDNICNISITAHFSVVILYNCSTPEENATSFNLVSTETTASSNKTVARIATTSQSMVSAPGSEPTTSAPPTTATDFNSFLDYKDRGTSVVVIALSVVICVLLIVVAVVIECMCRCRRNRTSKYGETSWNVTPLTVHQHISEMRLSSVVNTYVSSHLAANRESTTLPFSEGKDRQAPPENTYWEIDLADEDDRRPKQSDYPRKNCDFKDCEELKTYKSGRDADSGYSEVNLEQDTPVTVIQIADAYGRTPGRNNIKGCKGSVYVGSRQNAGYDHIKVNHLGLDVDNTNDTTEDNHRKGNHGNSSELLLLKKGETGRTEGQQDSSDNSESDSSLDSQIVADEETKSHSPTGSNTVCNFELAHEVRQSSEVETLEQADIQNKSDRQVEHDYFTLETTEKEVQISYDDDCSRSSDVVGDLNANNADTKGALGERPVNEYFKDKGSKISLGKGDYDTLNLQEPASAAALSNTSVLPSLNTKDDTYNHLVKINAKDESFTEPHTSGPLPSSQQSDNPTNVTPDQTRKQLMTQAEDRKEPYSLLNTTSSAEVPRESVNREDPYNHLD